MSNHTVIKHKQSYCILYGFIIDTIGPNVQSLRINKIILWRVKMKTYDICTLSLYCNQRLHLWMSVKPVHCSEGVNAEHPTALHQ